MGNRCEPEHDHKIGKTLSEIIHIECSVCFREMIATPGVDLNAASSDFPPPLLMCMEPNRFIRAKALLARGADPNIRDPQNGATALHVLCFLFPSTVREANEYLAVMEYLIEHKADVNAHADHKYTPAHILASCPADTTNPMSVIQGRDCRLIDAMKFLKDHDADINAKNELGHTLLDLLAITEKEHKALSVRRRGFVKLGCVAATSQ